MHHYLSLPLHKLTRDNSLWLMYVCTGGRLRGQMNKNIFANSCEKQKSFICNLYFTFYEAVLSACSRRDLMVWKANSTVQVCLLEILNSCLIEVPFPVLELVNIQQRREKCRLGTNSLHQQLIISNSYESKSASETNEFILVINQNG